MGKEHEGQAHDRMVMSAPMAARAGFSRPKLVPTHYQYSIPLMNTQKSFWPDGGWATLQCWGLGLIILLEWAVLVKEVFFRH